MSILLADAKREFFDTLTDGKRTDCPCCGRSGKINKMPINLSMIVGFLWIVRWWEKNGHEWVDVPKVAPRHIYPASNYWKLKYWELLVPKGNTDPSKKLTGAWKPTEKGIDFAKGLIRLPRQVYLWNDEPILFDGDEISISDAVKLPKFHYGQLMDENNPPAFFSS